MKKLRAFADRYVFSKTYTCLICGRENFNDDEVCDECMKRLPLITEPCQKCGRQKNTGGALCKECESAQIEITKGISEYEYDSEIPAIIKRFKYNHKKKYKNFLVKGMINAFYKADVDVDVITYVPMSRKEWFSRACFNQSKYLAETFCKTLKLPLDGILLKNKNTRRQAKLGFKDRQRNLKDAFKLKKGINITGTSVLVIDDVLTTGATADSIGKTLFDKGAKNVYFLTVASVSHHK